MELETRMARLERRCRLVTAGLTMSLLLIGVFLFAGAAPQADDSTVRARRVEIVDAQGNTRILLGREEDDSYGVVVYGHERQAKSMMMAGTLDGSGVAMISAKAGKGRQGIMLMAQDDSLGVAIRDSQALRAGMFVDQGQAQFQLRDQKQDVVFIAPPGAKPIEGRK
jgi:hypothetical protein